MNAELLSVSEQLRLGVLLGDPPPLDFHSQLGRAAFGESIAPWDFASKRAHRLRPVYQIPGGIDSLSHGCNECRAVSRWDDKGVDVADDPPTSGEVLLMEVPIQHDPRAFLSRDFFQT